MEVKLPELGVEIMNQSCIKEKLSNEACLWDKKSSPPPYHAFKVLKEYFVFDTSTQRLYCIDKLTYHLLNECLNKTILEAKQLLINSGLYTTEEVESVYNEVKLLASEGLFDIPNYRLSEKEIEEKLDERVDKPVTRISLGVAESCNLSCIYCYCHQQGDITHRLMSTRVAKDAVDWLFKRSKDEKYLNITFFGGEPLMNKTAIFFVVKYSQKLAKKYKKIVRYGMTTNASLIDDKFVDFMNEYKFNLLISMDGPKELHDSQCPQRNGRGSFDKVLNASKKVLASKDIKSMVRCTVVSPTPNISKLIDFFKNTGFSSCYLGPAVNTEEKPGVYDFTTEDFNDFAKQHETQIPDILKKMKKGEKVYYNHFQKYLSKFINSNGKIFPSNCGAAASGCLFINVDGKIYPCHHHYGSDAWKLGSIYEKDELNVDLQKDYWINFRKATKKCETCWAGALCQGPCSADLMRSDGTYSNNIRFCESKKFFLEGAAYLYCKQDIINNNTERNQK